MAVVVGSSGSLQVTAPIVKRNVIAPKANVLEGLSQIRAIIDDHLQNGVNHGDLSGRQLLDQHPADAISVDTTGFDKNLSGDDDNLQKVAQKLNDLEVTTSGIGLPDIEEGDAGKVLLVKEDETGVEWGRIGEVEMDYDIASPHEVALHTDPETVVNGVGVSDWDNYQIREIGNIVYDPVTSKWVFPYTGRGVVDEGGPNEEWLLDSVGLLTSDDTLTWTLDPSSNPIIAHDTPAADGAFGAEDPYLAKNLDGTLYRDSEGRALLYAEEKLPNAPTHRGINLWRSAPNTLDGWTFAGRVLDRGAPGEWDELDRTSPLAVHVGDGHLVMLFEGRAEGFEVEGTGVAHSFDEGVTFVAESTPVLGPMGDGGWCDRGMVPDDIIPVGDVWVLLVHGRDPDDAYTVGRFVTTDEPDTWTDDTVFVELPGNPLHDTDTVMCVGHDPTRLVYALYSRPPAVVFSTVGPPDGGSSWDENRIIAIESKITAIESKNEHQDDRLDAVEQQVAIDSTHPVLDLLTKLSFTVTAATGSMVDVADFGTGMHDPLDESSDLDLDGGVTLVPNAAPTLPLHQAAALVPEPPKGWVLHGARVKGIEVSGGDVLDGNVNVTLARADGGDASGLATATGGEWYPDQGVSVATKVDSGPSDVLLVLDAPDPQVLGVVVGTYVQNEEAVIPTITLESIEWLWRPAAQFSYTSDPIDGYKVGLGIHHLMEDGSFKLPGLSFGDTVEVEGIIRVDVTAEGGANMEIFLDYVPVATILGSGVLNFSDVGTYDVHFRGQFSYGETGSTTKVGGFLRSEFQTGSGLETDLQNFYYEGYVGLNFSDSVDLDLQVELSGATSTAQLLSFSARKL